MGAESLPSEDSDMDRDNPPIFPPHSPLKPTTSDLRSSGHMDTPKRKTRIMSLTSVKERYKKQYNAPMDPTIREAILEKKMMGILVKALPGLPLGLLKEAIVQAMPMPIIIRTLVAPAVEVANVPLTYIVEP